MKLAKRIGLIVTYVLGIFFIISAINSHVNFETWALKEYGGKFAPALIGQNFNSVLLMVFTILAIMGLLTYALTRKPK